MNSSTVSPPDGSKPEHSQQNTSMHVTPKQGNNGRRYFFFVCILFVLPVIIAKVALEQEWFNYGVTNQGQLLASPVSLEALQLSHIQAEKEWLIIFNQPNTCNVSCQNTFSLLGNTYVALGKEMPRVTPIALVSNEVQSELTKHEQNQRWQFHQPNGFQHELLIQHQVLIVDPLGNVVMTHQIPSDETQLQAFGKSIITDMKKLLKYSRIG